MSEFNRRDFLKVTGGITAGLGVGVLSSASPFRALQLAVEWTQDQYVPQKGPERILKAQCAFCQSHCPVELRMIGRRPVKAENNNGGCAQAQLIIQSLLHPDRIRHPLKRRGRKGSGSYRPVNYDEAIADIGAKLKTLLTAGNRSRISSISHGRFTAPDSLLESFLSSAGVSPLYREPSLETLSSQALFSATGKTGSTSINPDDADFILSLGTDLFGGGFTRPDQAHRFVSRLAAGKAQYLQIGSAKNRSASLATTFIPVKPGIEAIAGAGLILALLEDASAAQPSNHRELRKFFSDTLTKKDIESMTGTPFDRFSDAAAACMRADKAAVIAGHGGFDAEGSAALMSCALVLNSMVSAFGKSAIAQTRPLQFTGTDAISSSADYSMLFLYNADPVHRSPRGEQIEQVLSKTETVISFSPFINDTDLFADYIFPAVYPIETAEAAMELAAPDAELRHPVDVIRSIFREAGVPQVFPNAAGKVITTIGPVTADIAALTRETERLRSMYSKLGHRDLIMIPVELPSIADGSLLAYPYANKSHPGTLIEKDAMSVLMNSATAAEQGLHVGERISLRSARGTLPSLRVRLSEIYPSGCVALPAGFGHSALSRYAAGAGSNIKRIACADLDPQTGFSLMHATPVRIV
jgi:anaerobic selenocysteine-containing dehydrogenase